MEVGGQGQPDSSGAGGDSVLRRGAVTSAGISQSYHLHPVLHPSILLQRAGIQVRD